MAKPLLTGGNGKSNEFPGTTTGQVPVWNNSTSEWAAAANPYDLPVEYPGAPTTSTKIVNFKAVRAYTIASSGHQGGQLTNPGSDVTFTVEKNGSSIGTITFGASGTFSSSITQTTFAVGDILTVTTQATSMGALDTPYFTLAMTLA